MDFQRVWEKIKASLISFWRWIKPYLSQFHKWRRRIWKKYHINKVILLLGLIFILVTSVYLFILAKQANVETLKSGLSQSTVIYDKDNEEAGTLYAQKGTYVELDAISPYIQDAVISTEDRNFYNHHGFDVKGIARAAVRMLTSGSTAGGGGSTITQQLAKNAYLTLDQTFDRKAKELFLAIEIEKKYSKEEILTMYLNNAYFGNGVWGVQDAARRYFGVNASDVTLSEAATIAGMLKGPGIYNPIDNPENANNRKNTVLSVMKENEKITAEQASVESQTNITDYLNDTYTDSESGYRYPYYFDAVIDEAVEAYGLDESDVMNKGYKIYTALDQNYQKQLEATYQNGQLFPADASDGAMVQSASVALNPKNGGVQALVGRRGEHVFRGFNFATQMKRSPGSTIKPLSVYSAALESGYLPSSTLQDAPQSYYAAQNYDGTYQGEVPMYQAVAQSLNLPAVWLLHEIGLQKGYDKAEEFGLSLSKSDKYYGLALGGLEKGVSPLTMAGAYSAFANDGQMYSPHLITKIVDSTGAVIVDNTDKKPKQVISKETAEQMTSMLLGTFSNGTAVAANPAGYTVAGKTGTTETNFDATKANDQWIVGYTPDVVISTWMGYEESSELHYLEGTSGNVVGRVFKSAAEGILPYTSNTSFSVADAYATGGEVVPADQVGNPSEAEDNAGKWKENLDQYGEKAKEGLKNFGDFVKDGVQGIGDAAKDLWRKYQSE
ncbi:PBP1A family penicillin-binding protein [Enterococcus thailandicus]|uniref:PBP1A family penicillin-binding protein n=1 Tax=Enterococcus thailandicus TaxID=417368 RepID=UPI000BB0C799|nr:PBP1A family penicillin-binding protein [Enterococcus thailandicus]ASZ08464.1 penicillin-binding protein [Enterococcus thailandicus]